MAKVKDLYAEGMATSFLYGDNHQKTRDINIIWEFVNSFGGFPNKRPEDSMLMHTFQVVLRNRGFKINSEPKEMK